jgi:hypothetical protein
MESLCHWHRKLSNFKLFILVTEEKYVKALFSAFNTACARLSHDNIPAAYNLLLYAAGSQSFQNFIAQLLDKITLPHQHGRS